MRAKFFAWLLLLASWLATVDSMADERYAWPDAKNRPRIADALHVSEQPRNSRPRDPDASLRENARQTSKQPYPLAESRRHILPLTWEAGRLFVDARLNNRIPIRCIVDTGANMSIIPASLAALMGFDKRRSLAVDIRGIGGIINGHIIELESLAVGTAESRNFDVIVVEDSLGGIALLGADFLSRFRMEIDYNRGEMVLHAGEGPYDGYPGRWWQEKFRLYERLKHEYARRVGEGRTRAMSAGVTPWSLGGVAGTRQLPGNEVKDHETYLAILEHKLHALQARANRVALPQVFRQ
jgi:clan AA aspartic protease (TIGR02281 family)